MRFLTRHTETRPTLHPESKRARVENIQHSPRTETCIYNSTEMMIVARLMNGNRSHNEIHTRKKQTHLPYSSVDGPKQIPWTFGIKSLLKQSFPSTKRPPSFGAKQGVAHTELYGAPKICMQNQFSYPLSALFCSFHAFSCTSRPVCECHGRSDVVSILARTTLHVRLFFTLPKLVSLCVRPASQFTLCVAPLCKTHIRTHRPHTCTETQRTTPPGVNPA